MLEGDHFKIDVWNARRPMASDAAAEMSGIRHVPPTALLQATSRRDKFRVSRSEIFDGAVGIAAPYFDNANRVAGSIAVFGPEIRFNEQRIANVSKLVVRSAAELSAALGHYSGRQIQRPVDRQRA